MRHFLWRADQIQCGWVGPVREDMVLMRPSWRLHLGQEAVLLLHSHRLQTQLCPGLPDAQPTAERGEKVWLHRDTPSSLLGKQSEFPV